MSDEPRYGQRVPGPATPPPATPARAKPPRGPRVPSPIFIALVILAVVSGWALANRIGAVGLVTFVFVATAWVVTLCLHEFGHALTAYRNGDHSVVYRGYLTLDPLKYTHIMFSIVLPLLFLLLGGIGLPGGAVFIDRSALRTRFSRSAVSAAGPLTNIVIAALLAIAFQFQESISPLWAALAFLAFLQVTAAIINLLPVPGLDGFGIIEPYLPPRWLARAAQIAPFALIGVFVLLWIPQVNVAFFNGIFGIMQLIGVPPSLVSIGLGQFQFWR
ncbi:MAG: site-2 protease family protein [Pseudolysinimonas sp.]